MSMRHYNDRQEVAPVPAPAASRVAALRNVATRLRIASLRATSAAGSGHPTTCCSAAEIVAALFFAEMRYDPGDPADADSDRFVLSKGHAAPILYAAWAEAGIIPRERLMTLRRFDSDLEGHPTPRLPWVDVATGSLGQGICAAVGMALHARRIESASRTYVLLGDGETSEGSVWEAAALAAFDRLESLCAITDVNAFGQSRPTPLQHDLDSLAARWRAFGWHTIVVDGHDLPSVLHALGEARSTRRRPSMILAKTIKGKGVSFLEGREGWHGKVLEKGDELERAVAELELQLVPDEEPLGTPPPPTRVARPAPARRDPDPPPWSMGDRVATREACGGALARLGALDDRVVVLDADVQNSTFTQVFREQHPSRFHQAFIAEQVMVGAAMGLAARGAIPFAATFGAFFTRAYDFIRMAAISGLGVKLIGSHVGVSIGEDGPSQMALEDLAMMRAQPNMTVLYPCDAVSTERLLALMAYRPGPAYLRTSRPRTPVIYASDEAFRIGGLHVLRESDDDAATVIAAGVTVFEALEAHEVLQAAGVRVRVVDLYSVQPVDAAALVRCARETQGRLLTVEDHYASGGLGDAVAAAVAPEGFAVQRLAVREIPRSGTSGELLDAYGISARHIVAAVRAAVGG
jgi:transketolase